MSQHRGQKAARGDIPELDSLVKARRGQMSAIGTETHASDHFLVVNKRMEGLPGVDIPNADSLVIASRGQELSIGTEGHTTDPIGMAFPYPWFQEIVCGPNPHCLDQWASAAVLVTSGREELTVGTEDHIPRGSCLVELERFLFPGAVPDTNAPVISRCRQSSTLSAQIT